MCFPQIGNLGLLEQHGFARNRLWSVDKDPSPLPPATNQSTVDLISKSTEEDLKTWPHRFELRLRISVSAGKLTLVLRVRNVDSKAFSFMFALCNYFFVSDISYSDKKAYGQSKLANILHANELSRRLEGEGANITVNSVHPGLIMTNL
ncbi:hypothetical protein POM88_050444 [Heracleum sosnowskyi]|uniref:Glucose-6-phosphate 1-epimerase n=1 Tax=Heracleum sosnowskyi TaxID=360622 RepID=A0AAD8GYT3_9APIA|nr:hypothetical protein POM88_050444 [Heracleum sosnowskyi]